MQEAAIEVEDADVDTELVFFGAVAEAAQAENLGIGIGVEPFLFFTAAGGEVTGKHGAEAVVERGVAVFDMAKFVAEDGLQFVAREVVERTPADGEGQTVARAAEGEGVDAVIIAQDVGCGGRNTRSEAEFGDEVDVAVLQRIIIGAGGTATEGFGLFARALLPQLAFSAVIGL